MYRVCHFTSVHTAKDGRIFHKECRSLAKAGYEVYLVAPNAQDEEVDGVHIVGVEVKSTGRLGRILRTGKAVYKKALALNADIYHFHDPELLRFALRLKRKGKKVVFDSHEFYGFQIREKEYLPKFIRNVVADIYMWYEAYVCRRIDAVVQVCTIEGKDYFQDRCRRSIFVTNASDISNFKPDYEVPFEKRDKVVLVGALTKLRGVTFLVEATRYTSTKLTLVGKFSPDEYETEIKNMPEYHNVEHLGVVENQKLPGILNQALAGIATLLNVGQYYKIDVLPTKVYEYMAMGLPVIMSNSPYNIKLNALYQFGVCVNPAEPDEIADAINYLREHPDMAEMMGRKGRSAAEKHLNWKIEEKNLLELYVSLD